MTWCAFFTVSGRDRSTFSVKRRMSRLKSLPISPKGDFSSHHTSSSGAASAASGSCFSKSVKV